MKSKPIINQLNFQKISKSQLFVIRDKVQPPCHTPDNSQLTLNRQEKNIETIQAMRINLQECIQQLNRQIKQHINMKSDVCSRIKKYLISLRDNLPDDFTKTLKKFEEKQQVQLPLHKISSIIFPKQHLELIDDCRNRQPSFQNESNTVELRKNRMAKFRYNKQNHQHSHADVYDLEEKLKGISTEVERYKLDQAMQRQKFQKLEEKFQEQVREKQILACKLEEIILQNEDEKRNWKEDYKRKCQSFDIVLEDKERIAERLNEKQAQIVSLWQLTLKYDNHYCV